MNTKLYALSDGRRRRGDRDEALLLRRFALPRFTRRQILAFVEPTVTVSAWGNWTNSGLIGPGCFNGALAFTAEQLAELAVEFRQNKSLSERRRYNGDGALRAQGLATLHAAGLPFSLADRVSHELSKRAVDRLLKGEDGDVDEKCLIVSPNDSGDGLEVIVADKKYAVSSLGLWQTVINIDYIVTRFIREMKF